jgi:hypothetical protein
LPIARLRNGFLVTSFTMPMLSVRPSKKRNGSVGPARAGQEVAEKSMAAKARAERALNGT